MVPRFAVVCVSASLVCLLPLAAQPLDLADAHEGGGAAIGSWLSLAQEQIRSSEYHFALRSGPVANGLPPGYHAPNRAHDLRIGVSTDGVHVVSRTGDPGDWHWSVAVGEAAHGGAAVFASEAAATLSRPGLDVRVVNAMDGIEHVLAPSEAFTTDSEGKRFAARLAFDTDLAAHQVSGTALEFQRDGRPVLRYEIEGAAHAMGSPAGASLRLVEGGAATVAVVEARTDDAAGPLEVRARVTGLGGAHNWSGLGGQAWSGYGWSVATAGDVNGDGYSEVLVGASGYDEGMLDEGRVFLYRGSATGLASSADWTAGVGVEFAYFGASVATAGDVNADGYSDVIVGAPGAERVPGTHRKGAAYLWYGGASGLGPNGTLANADRELVASEVYEMFGRSVATAGDVDGDGYSDVVVGAPQDDQLSGGYGRVYLYKGAAFGLQVSHSWLEVSTEYADHFGASVATAGDVNGDGYSDLVIGAPFADYGGYSSSGAAYVYLGGPDVPADTAQMTWGPSDEAAQAGLGVSTAGDVNGDGYSDVLIGAPWFGVTPEETGAVFLMLGSSGGVLSTPTWSAKGDVARGWFGSGVATAGDVNGDGYGDILVGQQLGDRAYVWQGDADGLGPFGTTSNADWTGYGPSGTDYGARVATAGDVNGDGYSDVIVGAPGLTQVETEEGAAFLYYGGPGELADEPDWYRNIGQEGADLGFSVASAGDVNGDGYADVIAGAPGYDSGYPDEGMAMVYHGSAEGPIGSVSVLPIWRALGGQAGAAFGTSVASAGDVNGDGYSDVIVGAPEYDSGQSDEGAAFVWHGWSTGLQGDAGTVALANWSAQGDQADSGFGGAVASAGDVNGDGYADVAVGAKDFDFPEMDEGAVFVWHGSNAGLGDPGTPANSDWREDGDTDDASLGNSVASAGDVNRDGFSDLIAGGAYFAATWHGSSSGLGTAGVDWVKAGSQSTALFGYSVSSAGDVNGDGYSDVVIGAPLQTGSQSNEGAAWAYCGSPAGLASTACWADVGGLSLSAFGWSVSPAGDLDGDGFADIAVGAPGWTNGELAEGQVRVYYGSAWGPVSYSGGDWVYESDTAYANLGYSVAGVGDVTGEGFGDLMVGAPRQEFLGSQQGTVHVFYGGGGIGRQVLPRQTTTDHLQAIAPLGRSDSQSAFGVQLRAVSPSGRGKVKVTSEVKRADTSFDGSVTPAASWSDTGVGGLLSERSATGLDRLTPYHWRSRVQHSQITSPFDPPFSRWYHMPWNGWEEMDVRTSEPAYLVVNSSADDWQAHDIHPGDAVCEDERGGCTLRAAIEEANAHDGSDHISFAWPLEIELDLGEGPLPEVSGTVVIDASGVWDTEGDAPGVTIDGSDSVGYGLVLRAPVCALYGLHVTGFGDDGIRVVSDHNVIGSRSAGRGNVVSGNAVSGIHLDGAGAHHNEIAANVIGLSPDGFTASPNGQGVLIDLGAADNTVGGADSSDGNHISGNSGNGVSITGPGTDRNLLVGNAIGTTAKGIGVPGNAGSGVYVGGGAMGTLIGSDTGRGNLIRGAGDAGVTIDDADETILQSAWVIYNDGSGVRILHGSDCTIWNSGIAENGGYGIEVIGADAFANLLTPNSVFRNAYGGINLAEGGNGGVTAPTVVLATSSAASGTACAGCAVSLYSDDADQGRVHHGTAYADPVTGEWSYSGLLDGPFVTALATDGWGNTSAFSTAFEIGGGKTFVVDSELDGVFALDDNLGDGLCHTAIGGCTLRAAIDETNALDGDDTITFARPMTITIESWSQPGYVVEDAVTIDAGSVWDTAANAPGVTVSGGGDDVDVLTINADGCAVHGLHVTGSLARGIVVQGSNNRIGASGVGRGNFVTGNVVGVMVTGTGTRENTVAGNTIGQVPDVHNANGNGTGIIVADHAYDTMIGGPDAADANLILGNTGRGILIQDEDTNYTTISGNGIGVTLGDPRIEIGNGSDGVAVWEGPSGVGIGYDAVYGHPYLGNVISGNGGRGVHVYRGASAIQIVGNTIGQSGQSGILVEETSHVWIKGNTIHGNGQDGVTITGATSTGNGITSNSVYDNVGKAIALTDGANNGIGAPSVTAADPGGASGTACGGCYVEVYSDAADEGRTYHGMTIASAVGDWSYVGALGGPNITASNTDIDNNTSELSASRPAQPSPTPSATVVATPTDIPTASATATVASTVGPTSTTTITVIPSQSATTAATDTATSGPAATASRTATDGPSATPGTPGTATPSPGTPGAGTPTEGTAGTATRTATVTPTGGPSPAPAFVPIAAKGAAVGPAAVPPARTGWLVADRVTADDPCTDWIANGSFETGDFADWQVVGQPWMADYLAHDGTYSGVVGGRDNSNDTLYQELTIPDGATTALLEYWTYVYTQETMGTPTDYLFVELRDADGNELHTLERLDNTSPTGGWFVSSFALLDGYVEAGDTVRVVFHGTTDDALFTSFYIDEVSLQICAPATVTPSPTDTAPPTATSTDTATASATPMPTATSSPTASDTPTPDPTATATATPTVTPSPVPSETPTPSPASTDTATPTPAPTDTPTPTPAPTQTSTATPAPSETATSTMAPADTATPTPSESPTDAGPPTPTPMLVDVRLDGLEVTQGLQSLVNDVPLVSGKVTWARLIVATDGQWWSVAGSITGRLNGSVTSPPAVPCDPVVGRSDLTLRQRRGTWDRTMNCPVPAAWLAVPGELVIEATVRPVRAYDPDGSDNSRTATLTVENSPPLHYDVVQVRDGGFLGIGAKGPSYADYRRMGMITDMTYPVTRVTVHPHRRWIPWLGDVQTLTLLAVVDLLDRDPGPNTIIMGVVRPEAWSVSKGGMGLPTRHAWIKTIQWAYDYAAAHEAAHGFGLGHVNACGAYWPPVDGSYPYPKEWFSAGGAIDHWGLVLGTGTPMVYDPTDHADIMTYCPIPWISPYSYNKLRAALGSGGSSVNEHSESAPALAGVAPGATAAALPGVGAGFRTLQLEPATEYVVVAGYLEDGGASATLMPAMRRMGAELDPQAKTNLDGPYRLQLLGDDGAVLEEIGFGVTEGTHLDGAAPFTVVVPYREGTSRIVVRSADAELTSLDASQGTPDVQIDGLSTVGEFERLASWTASDPDGDTLTATVFFSADGGTTWQLVVHGIQGDEAEIDARLWPETDEGALKVVVTDGLNTAEDTWGMFQVDQKAPLVLVAAPSGGSVLPPDSQASFTCMAYDAEDGQLEDGLLAWRSDRDGDLGTGSRVVAGPLSRGWHTVTVTGRDSAGNAASDSVRVFVGHRALVPISVARAPVATTSGSLVAGAGAPGSGVPCSYTPE